MSELTCPYSGATIGRRETDTVDFSEQIQRTSREREHFYYQHTSIDHQGGRSPAKMNWMRTEGTVVWSLTSLAMARAIDKIDESRLVFKSPEDNYGEAVSSLAIMRMVKHSFSPMLHARSEERLVPDYRGGEMSQLMKAMNGQHVLADNPGRAMEALETTYYTSAGFEGFRYVDSKYWDETGEQLVPGPRGMAGGDLTFNYEDMAVTALSGADNPKNINLIRRLLEGVNGSLGFSVTGSSSNTGVMPAMSIEDLGAERLINTGSLYNLAFRRLADRIEDMDDSEPLIWVDKSSDELELHVDIHKAIRGQRRDLNRNFIKKQLAGTTYYNATASSAGCPLSYEAVDLIPNGDAQRRTYAFAEHLGLEHLFEGRDGNMFRPDINPLEAVIGAVARLNRRVMRFRGVDFEIPEWVSEDERRELER